VNSIRFRLFSCQKIRFRFLEACSATCCFHFFPPSTKILTTFFYSVCLVLVSHLSIRHYNPLLAVAYGNEKCSLILPNNYPTNTYEKNRIELLETFDSIIEIVSIIETSLLFSNCDKRVAVCTMTHMVSSYS
jgi:hypothetical protein